MSTLRMMFSPCCHRYTSFVLNHSNAMLSTVNWSRSVSSVRRTFDPLVTISVPVRMQQKIENLRKRIRRDDEKKKSQQVRRKGLKQIITCKRQQLNHYKGETYGKFEAVNLASKGWAHKKSKGDFFVINRYSDNPSKLDGTKHSFETIGLRREIVESLNRMQLSVPTSIQALAIPHLLNGVNAICAAETGSGKTLAYLLPILHRILGHKEHSHRAGIFCSPLALILVPGRELAFQIDSVLRKLTESLPIKTALFLGGQGTKQLLLSPPIQEVDIVVSSLGVFRKLVSSHVYEVRDVRHVVIDEADTMLDDSFNDEVVRFLKKFQFRDEVMSAENYANPSTQLCLIGATFPRSLDAILSGVIAMDSLVKIKTSHLHRLMSHVKHTFLRLRKMDKPAKLLELVKADVQSGKQVVVFSKNASTCNYINLLMAENDIKSINFQGTMNGKLRYGRFEMFQQGLVDVLSCTDLASRGLDMNKVHHIINYDFPNFVSDYIHRAGRTGRVSSVDSGQVTSFISSRREVDLVQKIEMAVRKAEDLPNVNANISRQLNKHKLQEQSI